MLPKHALVRWCGVKLERVNNTDIPRTRVLVQDDTNQVYIVEGYDNRIDFSRLGKRSLEKPLDNIDYYMVKEQVKTISNKNVHYIGGDSIFPIQKGNILALCMKDEQISSYMIMPRNKSKNYCSNTHCKKTLLKNG
jgi:hypothetical protein